jgi:hypothetical protein
MKTILYELLISIISLSIMSGCTSTYKLQHEGLIDLRINQGTDSTLYAANYDSYFTFVSKGADTHLIDFDKVNNYYTAEQISANNTSHPDRPIGNAGKKVTYKTPAASLKDYQYTLDHGVTQGLLVVPFKYRTHDDALTGGSTVGYYAGYQKNFYGIRTTVLASLGLSPIATQDVNTKEIDNKWGLTGAAGVIWTLPASLQLGIVAGYDHLGGPSGKDWQYENNLWLSIAIGFNFIQ